LSGQEPEWSVLIDDCLAHPEDDATLTRFFRAILPYLRATLLATYPQNPDIVDDALQSAAIKYIQIFQVGRKARLTEGYFIVIAKNCLVDELRRRKGHVPIDEVMETEIAWRPTEGVDPKEARMLLLQHALLKLESRCQFILESYYIQEMDSSELARYLKVSPESVHMAIKRCRDKLRLILSDATR
jgi:RNA polymerase sigma factor (sigma-70 family)